MAQWGNRDNAANSVLWAAALLNKPANTANRTALFGNTTQGAFIAGAVVSQEGLTNAEMSAGDAAHAGWNLKTTGTGSLESITITAGGAGYANTDTVTVAASGDGSANASATIRTNANGAITSVTITDNGKGFTAKNPTLTINTDGGTGATLVATAGGRAGRVSYETLVAMGSLS